MDGPPGAGRRSGTAGGGLLLLGGLGLVAVGLGGVGGDRRRGDRRVREVAVDRRAHALRQCLRRAVHRVADLHAGPLVCDLLRDFSVYLRFGYAFVLSFFSLFSPFPFLFLFFSFFLFFFFFFFFF